MRTTAKVATNHRDPADVLQPTYLPTSSSSPHPSNDTTTNRTHKTPIKSKNLVVVPVSQEYKFFPTIPSIATIGISSVEVRARFQSGLKSWSIGFLQLPRRSASLSQASRQRSSFSAQLGSQRSARFSLMENRNSTHIHVQMEF